MKVRALDRIQSVESDLTQSITAETNSKLVRLPKSLVESGLQQFEIGISNALEIFCLPIAYFSNANALVHVFSQFGAFEFESVCLQSAKYIQCIVRYKNCKNALSAALTIESLIPQVKCNVFFKSVGTKEDTSVFNSIVYAENHPFISEAKRIPVADQLKSKRRDSAVSLKSIESLYCGKSSTIIDFDMIDTGKELRTTIMIRNIPNKYTPFMLQEFINTYVGGEYDFFYLRMDFKNKCNVGYAFINFVSSKAILSLKCLIGLAWPCFKSSKRFDISFASIQGKNDLIRKFQNSSVMLAEDPQWRPRLFSNGLPQEFPKPLNGVYRPKSDILYSRSGK